MESEGNASIMVKEKSEDNPEGRMIIDTAASKLFLEFTEDGTARWISNAAVWLCNTEEFEEERKRDPSLTSGIKMDDVEIPGKKMMEKRQVSMVYQKRFCLSIVIDTTGSMGPYISATRDNIENLIDSLNQLEKECGLPEGGIVCQVVQYKDYADKMVGEVEEYITGDVSRLKNKLNSFKANGGADGAGCGSNCEDIQGGLIRALEQMKKPPFRNYNHLVLIVGDYPNHGDFDQCKITKNRDGELLDDVWERIYKEIRSLNSVHIMFMPVNFAEIVTTMKRMQRKLGTDIVNSTSANRSNFVKIITETTVNEYKKFVGIS